MNKLGESTSEGKVLSIGEMTEILSEWAFRFQGTARSHGMNAIKELLSNQNVAQKLGELLSDNFITQDENILESTMELIADIGWKNSNQEKITKKLLTEIQKILTGKRVSSSLGE